MNAVTIGLVVSGTALAVIVVIVATLIQRRRRRRALAARFVLRAVHGAITTTKPQVNAQS